MLSYLKSCFFKKPSPTLAQSVMDNIQNYWQNYLWTIFVLAVGVWIYLRFPVVKIWACIVEKAVQFTAILKGKDKKVKKVKKDEPQGTNQETNPRAAVVDPAKIILDKFKLEARRREIERKQRAEALEKVKKEDELKRSDTNQVSTEVPRIEEKVMADKQVVEVDQNEENEAKEVELVEETDELDEDYYDDEDDYQDYWDDEDDFEDDYEDDFNDYVDYDYNEDDYENFQDNQNSGNEMDLGFSEVSGDETKDKDEADDTSDLAEMEVQSAEEDDDESVQENDYVFVPVPDADEVEIENAESCEA